MSARSEFERKSHVIPVGGEFRGRDSGQSRNPIDPATEDVIARGASCSFPC